MGAGLGGMVRIFVHRCIVNGASFVSVRRLFAIRAYVCVCVLKFSKAVSVFGFFWSVKRDKLLAKLTRK